MQRVGDVQSSDGGGLGGSAPLLDAAPGGAQELVDAWVHELREAGPERVVARALEQGGGELVISFSGAEDVLLLEYAHRSGRPFRVLTLDTGRLHPETYRFLERVEQHYGVRLEVMVPATAPLESLVREKGLFSFYRDGHQECCGIRKVEPLARRLSSARMWMTGQRRDQSPDTRDAIEVVELDRRFVGEHGAPLIKWNPLARTSSADVWDAIRAFDVPFNPLHSRGFVSIGCEPCTRATLPGQHEREGRWWWEHAEHKECGLHLPGSDGERP
jgi:phosphoadenosine phosphosulfate reductase